MVVLLALAATSALAVPLMLLGRSRYGQLLVSEVPGFLFVLLAGRACRAQAREILASRARLP